MFHNPYSNLPLNTVVRQSSVQKTKHTSTRNSSNLYSGKVIGVRDGTSVDVKLFSGDVLRNVRVLLNSASTVAGFRYLASIKNVAPVDTSEGTDDSGSLSHESDIIAIIGFLDGNWQTPRVIGFDFPLDSQLHLDESGLSVNSHESGVYTVITKGGHHETHYPDGSYIIYGPNEASKDMTAIKGRGKNWSPATTTTHGILTINLAQGLIIQAKEGVLTLNGKRVAVSGDAVSTPSGPGVIV